MTEPLNILLADDDESFALLIETITAEPALAERCTVHRVCDGTEAVDYVLGDGVYADRAHYPFPDLIVLDQRMKRMDGSEALEQIKRDDRGRRVPVCILSTSRHERLHETCYRNAATFCVEKPLDYGELKAKIGLMVEFFTTVVSRPDRSG